jgi:hypothetical protein
MVEITLSPQAYAAIVATLPADFKIEGERQEDGHVAVCFAHSDIVKFNRLKAPGESYSDVILRTILPIDATLRTIAGGLTVEYVRHVLENMWKFKRDFGDIRVIISLISGSSFPDYSFDFVIDDETGQEQLCGAFSGKTHREIDEEKAGQRRWSHQGMARQEVAILLGEIRKLKKASD